MTREGLIQDAIREALGDVPELALYRNNVGVAKHFDPRTHRETVVKYGLFNGSADLIGVYRGRFVSLEVKTPEGRATKEQLQWARVIRACGGHAAFVRSAEEAMHELAVIDALLKGGAP